MVVREAGLGRVVKVVGMMEADCGKKVIHCWMIQEERVGACWAVVEGLFSSQCVGLGSSSH